MNAKERAKLYRDPEDIKFSKWVDDRYPIRNRNFKGEVLYSRSKYDDFYLISELVQIYKKKNDFKFIIQLSDTIYPETEHARNMIINLEKYNKKIIIHHGFLNFLNWRRFLKK